MRTGSSRHDRLLDMVERRVGSLASAGLARIRIDDHKLAGDQITIAGRKLVNFGSCAYLGLNLDPRLTRGAIEALERFGPVYSSSTAYTSVDLYTELEDRLVRIFQGHVVVPTTTTLAHLACLPVVVGENDHVLVDAQAHASVHLATDVLVAQGVSVLVLPHNDVGALVRRLNEISSRNGRIWYLADGIYSMWGDLAPVGPIVALLDEYPNLHLYLDDAHWFGWKGLHGRGHVLEQIPLHPRMVVAVSLAKSFGSGGAALAFGDPDMARRVTLCGTTMIFSGPLHPAELGAAVASADIHLSAEHAVRQARLLAQIELIRKLLSSRGLPVMSSDRSPIWFVRVGGHRQSMELALRLMEDGFYLNIATFPAVPVGYSGLRFTHTLYHSDDQIASMIDALARRFAEVAGEPEVLIDLTAEEKLEVEAGQAGERT